MADLRSPFLSINGEDSYPVVVSRPQASDLEKKKEKVLKVFRGFPETLIHLILDYCETTPGLGSLQAWCPNEEKWQASLEKYCKEGMSAQFIKHASFPVRERAPVLLDALYSDIQSAARRKSAGLTVRSCDHWMAALGLVAVAGIMGIEGQVFVPALYTSYDIIDTFLRTANTAYWKMEKECGTIFSFSSNKSDANCTIIPDVPNCTMASRESCEVYYPLVIDCPDYFSSYDIFNPTPYSQKLNHSLSRNNPVPCTTSLYTRLSESECSAFDFSDYEMACDAANSAAFGRVIDYLILGFGVIGILIIIGLIIQERKALDCKRTSGRNAVLNDLFSRRVETMRYASEYQKLLPWLSEYDQATSTVCQTYNALIKLVEEFKNEARLLTDQPEQPEAEVAVEVENTEEKPAVVPEEKEEKEEKPEVTSEVAVGVAADTTPTPAAQKYNRTVAYCEFFKKSEPGQPISEAPVPAALPPVVQANGMK